MGTVFLVYAHSRGNETKEEGIICRLMARSGRLPSGFDYTLIKIIINTKLIRNRKFNIID